MQTITLQANEKQLSKLIEVFKELNISYEIESADYEKALSEYESGKTWEETKQELHKALNDYESGKARLYTLKEVENITNDFIARA